RSIWSANNHYNDKPWEKSSTCGGNFSHPSPLEEFALKGPGGELVPGGELEFAQHRRNVGLNSFDRDEELCRHLFIGEATGDKSHHLKLASAEPIELLINFSLLTGGGTKSIEHETGKFR